MTTKRITTAASVLLSALAVGQILLMSGPMCLPACADTTDGASDTSKATTDGADNLSEGDMTVEDVTIEGNRLVPQEDILNVIGTHRGDHYDREQVMKDLKAVNGMGYFDDRSLQAIPEKAGNGVLLKIRVQENAPITQFAFQGNTVLSSEELSHLFADQLGKPQNLTQLSQSIEKIENAYHEKGFMLARIVDVKDDPDGSVSIKVDEGKISDIKIVGNKKTRDFIIRNQIKLKPGEVYNERQLTADLRKLFGNGYFNDIRRSLSPDPTNPEKYQLKVEVDEKRTGSIGLGGGVDSVVGGFGSASFVDSNFRGRGQLLSFNSQLGTGMLNGVANNVNNGGTSFLPNGGNNFNVEATWMEPNLRGSKTSLSVTGFGRNYASMMVDDSMQRSVGGTVALSRPLKGHWSASLGLTGDRTTLTGYNGILGNLGNNTLSAFDQLSQNAMAKGMDAASAATFAQNVRNQQLQGGTYLTVSPSLHYDTRDRSVDPTRGTFAKITAGPSVGLNGNSFFKAGASVSKYKQITKETTLAMNVQGGQSMGGLPQFSQYRLGGLNGVRGYRQFSDLGTGTGLLMGSAELRHRLPLPKGDKSSAGGMMLNWIDKNVKGVAFTDFGAVSGNGLINGAYNRSMVAGSVGLGLRMNIPMLGLIRLDYGLPLLSSAMGGRLVPRFTVGFGDKF